MFSLLKSVNLQSEIRCCGAICWQTRALTRPVPSCYCRFCQHQRPEHAGKEGQRGGGDRGGLGDGDRGDGRTGVPSREIRPAAPPRVLQVHALISSYKLKYTLKTLNMKLED